MVLANPVSPLTRVPRCGYSDQRGVRVSIPLSPSVKIIWETLPPPQFFSLLKFQAQLPTMVPFSPDHDERETLRMAGGQLWAEVGRHSYVKGWWPLLEGQGMGQPPAHPPPAWRLTQAALEAPIPNWKFACPAGGPGR